MRVSGLSRENTFWLKEPWSLRLLAWLTLVAALLIADVAAAQTTEPPAPVSPPTPPAAPTAETTSADQATPAAKSVSVAPTARDDEIADRIQRILRATDWFASAEVNVDEGVVFLQGSTKDTKFKDWATQLAQNTEDVVAVVNRIQVIQRSFWDLTPAVQQMNDLGRQTVQALPLMAISLAMIMMAWLFFRWGRFLAQRAIARHWANPILQQVGARAVSIPILIIGIYLALRVAGLTQIAATIMGGTGLVGLIVGIAFRDIAENFLASILISMQRPFELGDLVEVNNVQGIVQSVTTRGTLLMTMDGNHVQIPNSLIYKNVVRNLTANPKIRLNFTLPGSPQLTVDQIQTAIMKVLTQHDAVQADPEPLVLVDEVTMTQITLRIYCWIDSHQFSPLKVRSALLRLSTKALADLSAAPSPTGPDKVAETPFLHGENGRQSSKRNGTVETHSHRGEGGLHNEQQDIQKQARANALPSEGVNLLTANPAPFDHKNN